MTLTFPNFSICMIVLLFLYPYLSVCLPLLMYYHFYLRHIHIHNEIRIRSYVLPMMLHNVLI